MYKFTGIALQRLGAIVAAAFIGLAGTTQATAQDLDLTPLPEGETIDVRIGVGGVASTTQVGIWVAEYAGFFAPLREEGINVELIPFGGGSDAMLALIGGQTDFTYQFLENGIRANAQGRDVVSLYQALPVPALAVTVRSGMADEIQTVPDIAGHRWGFTSFGSGTHVVSLRVATHYGLDPAYVSWTPVGGSRGYLPSIREERVDVLTSSVNAGLQLAAEGSGKLLVDLTDPATVEEVYGYPYISIALMGKESYVNEHPYVAYKIVEAVQKAVQHIKDTPAEEIASILPEEFQSEVLVPSLAVLAKAHDANGNTPVDVVAHMVADMEDLDMASGQTVDPAMMVDNRFIDAVQASNGN